MTASHPGTLSHAAARRVVEAAVAAAGELGVPMNVAVVDEAGHLAAFVRMDGALLVSAGLAQDKAYTAALFRQPTRDLAEKIQPGGSLFGLTTERFMPIPGGLPLQAPDRIVGAIGVSSGTIEEDEAVARAGAAALQPPKGA